MVGVYNRKYSQFFNDLGILHFRKPPYMCIYIYTYSIYIYIYTHTQIILGGLPWYPTLQATFHIPLAAQISPSSFLVEVPLPGSTADPVVAYLKDDWCLSCNSAGVGNCPILGILDITL